MIRMVIKLQFMCLLIKKNRDTLTFLKEKSMCPYFFVLVF